MTADNPGTKVALRLLNVVALALFVVGAVITVLPVSETVFGAQVGCNPASISAVSNEPVSGTSYIPAIAVWVDPSSVVPSGTDPNNAAGLANVCKTAAQNQLIPAVILFGIAIVLVIVGRAIVGYVMTGEIPAKPGWYRDPTGTEGFQWWDGTRWRPKPGWYPDPTGAFQWWDGTRWTGEQRPDGE